MANNTSPLVATFHGHINSTIDALILFEAALSGQLNHVPRRPHDRERQGLIKSGNVFIYKEHASGVKRWTDGVSWSPSRILGNFLIYRELEKPFPPGEKKRALKKSKKLQQGITKTDTSRNNGIPFSGGLDPEAVAKDSERALIGSLVDSYPFKEGGLIKKAISVQLRGIPHHLVSYYTVEEVMNNVLITPSMHLELRPVIPRPELLTSQNFRSPVEEGDPSAGSDRIRQAYMQGSHQYMPPPASVLQRAMSLPSFSQPSVLVLLFMEKLGCAS
ncbi:Gti1/Pac2 family-domain-containing protein [Ilyonectria destructans]|nr:Gti1/Pac2 family-domain-containing protein [Ilyonectria destructans]